VASTSKRLGRVLFDNYGAQGRISPKGTGDCHPVRGPSEKGTHILIRDAKWFHNKNGRNMTGQDYAEQQARHFHLFTPSQREQKGRRLENQIGSKKWAQAGVTRTGSKSRGKRT
jgi:hypothetical protein